MSFTRRMIKSAGSKLGVELMTPRGLADLKSGTQHAATEYVRLLARMRGIEMVDDALRSALLANLVGTGVGEASHLLCCLASVKHLPGDVCEFGVGSGATSVLLANELRHTEKRLWLYDTFAGLPAPTAEDQMIDDIDNLGSMSAYEGRMSHSEMEVRRRLTGAAVPASSIRIVQGLFDESVSADQLPSSVCFAYVDFDFYAPIRTALAKLLPRLAPGGIVVVDDYGFFSKGAQSAIDEFFEANEPLFRMEIPDYCFDRFAILHRVAQ